MAVSGERSSAKELAGWAAVALAGVLAFWLTRPGPPGDPGAGAPPGPTPGGRPTPPPATGRASLGVRLVTAEGGLGIGEVYSGSNAARAGLVAGDVILAVDGVPADAPRVLLDRLDRAREGGSIALAIRRADGAEEAVTVALARSSAFELELAERLLAAAVDQLAAARRPDGLWPHYQDRARPSVAVTALVGHALARAGPDVGPGVPALLSEVRARLLAAQRDDGGLDDPAERVPHRVYATALAALALEAPARAGDAAAREARARMLAWLARAQVQEAHGYDPIDARYGGWSYYDAYESAALRTDVSTARFALEALASGALPDDDPVWDRARLWLDLTQNHALALPEGAPGRALEEELRDGGFGFTPRQSKAGQRLVGRALLVYGSYGSATADGALGLLAVLGVDRRAEAPAAPPRDPALAAALGWLGRRLAVERNPGFERDEVGWGQGIHLYWLAALAEALHRAGVARVVAPDGAARDWAAELVRHLGTLHARARDRFAGASALMHEDSPTVAAAFAALALAAARDRLRLGGADLGVGAAPALPPARDPDAVLAAGGDAVRRGVALFQARGCVGCHADREGGNGPSLVGLAERALARHGGAEGARAHLRAFLRRPDPARALAPGAWSVAMPPVEPAQVDDAALEDLVAFLLSRRAGLPVSEAR